MIKIKWDFLKLGVTFNKEKAILKAVVVVVIF